VIHLDDVPTAQDMGALASDPRRSALIARYVRETCKALGANDATLWNLIEDSSILVPAASATTSAELFPRMRTQVSESIIGIVASMAMPTLVGPEDEHNPNVDSITGVPTLWMVAAPLFIMDRVRGVLSAIQANPDKAFGREHLEQVTWHAEILGLVLSQLLIRADDSLPTVT
jgi:hypothetical protein